MAVKDRSCFGVELAAGAEKSRGERVRLRDDGVTKDHAVMRDIIGESDRVRGDEQVTIDVHAEVDREIEEAEGLD